MEGRCCVVVICAHIIAHNNKLLKYQQAATKLRLRYYIFIIGRSIPTSTHNLTLRRIFSTFQSTNYLTVRLTTYCLCLQTTGPHKMLTMTKAILSRVQFYDYIY